MSEGPPGPGRLIRFLNTAVGSINIVSGEANPRVYNEQTYKAIKKVHEGGAKITILVGPFLLPLNHGQSIMKTLADEDTIDLYIASKRRDHHFAVDEKGALLYEKPHEPNALERVYIEFKRNKFEAKAYRKEFERLLKSKEVVKYVPNKTKILFVSPEELEVLKDKSRRENRKRVDYTSSEIQSFNIGYLVPEN